MLIRKGVIPTVVLHSTILNCQNEDIIPCTCLQKKKVFPVKEVYGKKMQRQFLRKKKNPYTRCVRVIVFLACVLVSSSASVQVRACVVSHCVAAVVDQKKCPVCSMPANIERARILASIPGFFAFRHDCQRHLRTRIAV